MADFGISEAIAITAAAASATTAAAAANAQAQAAARSRQQARVAAQAKRKQVSRAAELEKTKARNRAEMLRGRLRVTAAERAVGTEGSTALLEQQIDFDRSLNTAIIEANAESQRGLIDSRARSALASLVGPNVLIAGFQGGLAGASTGLAIGGATEDLIKKAGGGQETK